MINIADLGDDQVEPERYLGFGEECILSCDSAQTKQASPSVLNNCETATRKPRDGHREKATALLHCGSGDCREGVTSGQHADEDDHNNDASNYRKVGYQGGRARFALPSGGIKIAAPVNAEGAIRACEKWRTRCRAIAAKLG